jgi:hypothetical protein
MSGSTKGPNHPIGERWRSAIGSVRSLVIYYGNPIRRWRMDRLYSDFVRQGDLVFDIGSHVGDRIGSFRRLGCQVVAVGLEHCQTALIPEISMRACENPNGPASRLRKRHTRTFIRFQNKVALCCAENPIRRNC